MTSTIPSRYQCVNCGKTCYIHYLLEHFFNDTGVGIWTPDPKGFPTYFTIIGELRKIELVNEDDIIPYCSAECATFYIKTKENKNESTIDEKRKNRKRRTL